MKMNQTIFSSSFRLYTRAGCTNEYNELRQNVKNLFFPKGIPCWISIFTILVDFIRGHPFDVKIINWVGYKPKLHVINNLLAFFVHSSLESHTL